MFEDRKFVLAGEFPDLEPVIEANGGEIVDWKDRFLREISPQLVIISDNIDFSSYDKLNTMMVPIVTPQWVHHSVSQGKQVPTKPYSPDPKHFMRKVTICTVGLSPGDQEGFKAGIKAAGGEYNDILTTHTTHVIATSLENDICATARDTDLDIAVVSPEWFDDCMKLGRKIKEDPYYLSPEDVKNTEESPALIGTYYATEATDTTVPQKAIERSVSHALGSTVFADRVFYLGSDLELSEKMRKHIIYLAEANGGEIATSLDKANTYLGKWRQGEEYITASKNRYAVGNLLWLYWMAIQQRWELPTKHLLHYPEVPDGLPDMKDKVICITNYTGEARNYLRTLIQSIGASYTGTMCGSTNTHLIAAFGQGPKYEAAKNWGIKIVNHLWLEDSYSKWMLQDVNVPRYQYLPKNLDLTTLIGSTPLSTMVLRQFYVTQSTPVIERHLPARAARDKAQKGVHSSVLKENLFKKQGKKHTEEERADEPAPSKPLSKTATPEPPAASPKSSPPEPSPRPSSAASKKRQSAAPKRQKLDTVKIIMTNVDASRTKGKLAKLGIKVVESGNANILVAPQILKTQKFLCSLNTVDSIVSPAWLDACVKESRIVESEAFELKGTKQLIEKSKLLREQNKKVFTGRKFLISGSIRVGSRIVEEIVKAHGGKVVRRDGENVIYVRGEQEDSDSDVTLDYLIKTIMSMTPLDDSAVN